MGIFDFLKFKEKEEIEEIKLEELEPWIDSWSKKAFEDANLKLVSIRQRITEEKNKLLESIQNLEKAELKNPNIPERAKQIMEGNRKTYILKLNSLLEEINLPEKLDG